MLCLQGLVSVVGNSCAIISGALTNKAKRSSQCRRWNRNTLQREKRLFYCDYNLQKFRKPLENFSLISVSLCLCLSPLPHTPSSLSLDPLSLLPPFSLSLSLSLRPLSSLSLSLPSLSHSLAVPPLLNSLSLSPSLPPKPSSNMSCVWTCE